jgi:hypothetical protein
MGYERPAGAFFVCARAHARAYMSLIASAVLLAAPVLAAEAPADVKAHLETIGTSLDVPTWQAAVAALVKAGPAVVPFVIDDMPKHPRIRARYMLVIEGLEGKAIPALIDLFPDQQRSAAAGTILFEVAKQSHAEHAAALLACAKIPVSQLSCGQTLVKVSGPKASGKHVNLLLAALEDKDKAVRVFAAVALAQTGSPKAAEPIAKLLAENDSTVQVAAANALKKLGKKAKAAAPALKQLSAAGPRAEVKQAVDEALREIDG